jgi:hypothetical protein
MGSSSMKGFTMMFVDNAKRAWRWFSVQAMVVAAAMQGAWVFIPDDMRTSIPHGLVQGATIGLLALGVAGRLVQQTPKPPAESDTP